MGRAPCCDKANVKKGPWSPEEDAKLKDFIHKSGTGGNWIALPQKAGLRRCGKSCRLRWLNYLRPNIKHGDFTDEEDRVICTLYASIGSRWSVIAGQLPGRTDNDIKNYWNTKLKKKLMGVIPSNLGRYSNTFHNHTQSHDQSLSTLYTDYTTSLSYSNLDKSLNHLSQNIFSLSTSQYPCFQEGLVGFTGLYKDKNMLMFGGNEASCSSSDGTSCSQMSYGNMDQVKQEEMGCGFQGFNNNGFDQEKFMVQYGSNQVDDPLMVDGFLDQKMASGGVVMGGDLEEVKQLMSIDHGGNSNTYSWFNDENKTHEREQVYYY